MLRPTSAVRYSQSHSGGRSRSTIGMGGRNYSTSTGSQISKPIYAAMVTRLGDHNNLMPLTGHNPSGKRNVRPMESGDFFIHIFPNLMDHTIKELCSIRPHFIMRSDSNDHDFFIGSIADGDTWTHVQTSDVFDCLDELVREWYPDEPDLHEEAVRTIERFTKGLSSPVLKH